MFPKCFIHVEKVHGDRKLMDSVKVLANPVKEKCLRVHVIDPLLREGLGPEVVVNLVPYYTNSHLSIIHVYTHTQHSAPCWAL